MLEAENSGGKNLRKCQGKYDTANRGADVGMPPDRGVTAAMG